MKATDVLREEHEAVRVAMRILGKICDRVESGKEFEIKHLEQLLDFIRVFTDKCHHGKEEDVLFPAMEEIGIPREGGPVGVMLSEHETMREYIRNFADALDEYASGDKSATDAIVENVRTYLRWLDGHIEKENNILFVMADSHLSADKQEELFEAFETLEEERIGKDVHEQFHQMLHELKAVYLEPRENSKTI